MRGGWAWQHPSPRWLAYKRQRRTMRLTSGPHQPVRQQALVPFAVDEEALLRAAGTGGVLSHTGGRAAGDEAEFGSRPIDPGASGPGRQGSARSAGSGRRPSAAAAAAGHGSRSSMAMSSTPRRISPARQRRGPRCRRPTISACGFAFAGRAGGEAFAAAGGRLPGGADPAALQLGALGPGSRQGRSRAQQELAANHAHHAARSAGAIQRLPWNRLTAGPLAVP